MFEFKPFDEMTPEDYAAIGLKAGLEVHQQLLTEKKIFCRCPAGRYSDKYDSEILRHMRPTLSELGEYDGTALMEFKTKKEIVYRIKRDTVCTYEMDDTPPFMLNEDALDIALEIAMLLNLNLVNELHISRKQYLDGSIPTGFQRTTILGVNGWIPFRGRRIGIYQLGLEEDACREVSDVGHERVYLTDRLGMPLAEPVTHPDMRTPQEVAEVGEVLRRLMRSTGKVRTGAGATRQDVNASVAGGTRIEIKGVSSLKRVPLLVYNEAMRQWNLLRIRGLLTQRGITRDTFKAATEDVTDILARAGYQPIRRALRALGGGGVARCVRLHGFAGILNEQTQTGTRFAQEFSDRLRVVACLDQLPNLIYSDDPAKTISSPQWKRMRERLGASAEDVLVVTWGGQADADTGASEIAIRGREATVGVPNETRQALADGTNGFERILPGPQRMYPDTDLPPMPLSSERFEKIRSTLPEPVWDRQARLEALGLPSDVISKLVISTRAPLFDRLVREMSVQPMLVGEVLTRHATALRRKGFDFRALTDEEIAEVLRLYQQAELAREGIVPVLQTLSRSGRVGESDGAVERVRAAMQDLGFSAASRDELKTTVARVMREFDPSAMRNPDKKHDYLMGVLMKQLRGRVEGRRVAEHLDAALSAATGE